MKTETIENTTYNLKVMFEEKKPKNWVKSVSTLANDLGGFLFFGANNDGVAKGLNNSQHNSELNNIKICDIMAPSLDIVMETLVIGELCLLQQNVTSGYYTFLNYVWNGYRCIVIKDAGFTGNRFSPIQLLSTMYATVDTQNYGGHYGDKSGTKLVDRQSEIQNLLKSFSICEQMSDSHSAIECDFMFCKRTVF